MYVCLRDIQPEEADDRAIKLRCWTVSRGYKVIGRRRASAGIQRSEDCLVGGCIDDAIVIVLFRAQSLGPGIEAVAKVAQRSISVERKLRLYKAEIGGGRRG